MGSRLSSSEATSRERVVGVLALVSTATLWGTSFPAIKIVVSDVEGYGYGYVWMRGLAAIVGLLPYMAYKVLRGGIDHKALKGGLLAGVIYSIGLWLQGVGTSLTTASNSSFITGLNVVFVHVYTALLLSRYSAPLAMSLVFSVAGLYLLVTPGEGPNLGDALVLAGAVFWAAQIIVVDKYSRSDPMQFTFFEMVPSLAFIVPDAYSGGITPPDKATLLYIAYLGLVCSDAAFTLQVYGQRSVSPGTTAVILLLEPPAGAFFSRIILGEEMTILQILGALLILVAMWISVSSELSTRPGAGSRSRGSTGSIRG